MCPEMIPSENLHCDVRRVLKYPGIKEDVYARRFLPDPGIRAKLELHEKDVVVVLRPPASEAHYHNPEAEKLFDEAIRFLSGHPDVKFVLLPRNERQAAEIRTRWLELFASGVMRIPEHVIDGVNLIWHSDLVISGGGTMNREAAALGVPVYSVFRGRIGAVDQYLSRQGRLVLLESAEDVREKISVARRHRSQKPAAANGGALRTIVEHIVSIMDTRCAPVQRNAAGALAGLPSMGAEASREFNRFESTKYF